MVSVATGHQEYHPVYVSPGVLTGPAQRAHGNGVLPAAFLPIPKTSKRHRTKPAYQKFVRQLYHACLARVFQPLKAAMTTPEIVQFRDRHFRRVVYGLGPYIADYPEKVWLTAIVQNWCPKCDAPPDDLDREGARILWDNFGIRSDVMPFTSHFPRANIHELLACDLLHQVIKGTFKDHLVSWVSEYSHIEHREKRALEIIQDIDRRISAVPEFPGLRWFPDGRDFNLWTGDNSKALMKIYLGAVTGYLPSDMVKALAAFMDIFYLLRRNSISADDLTTINDTLARFHHYRDIFSKHIKAVKEPWRRSSRFNALPQMLSTISSLDKMAASVVSYTARGMMVGTNSSYAAMVLAGYQPQIAVAAVINGDDDDEDDEVVDHGPKSLSSMVSGNEIFHGPPQPPYCVFRAFTDLDKWSWLVKLPGDILWSLMLLRYIFSSLASPPSFAVFSTQIHGPVADVALEDCPVFRSRIHVYHSAVARFYAPSDLCRAGGMYSKRIRSNPNWHGYPRRDTVLIDVDGPVMCGLVVGRVLLFFSFTFSNKEHQCGLVHWLVPVGDAPDPDTGMWVVEPELDTAPAIFGYCPN
ncbi:hypothetical protein B0H13DRAFT_2547938 [Mycena leptocephala]|nr:hypothetical protein B0H13DRAFT_2547938 [Mycena leptocephala]